MGNVKKAMPVLALVFFWLTYLLLDALITLKLSDQTYETSVYLLSEGIPKLFFVILWVVLLARLTQRSYSVLLPVIAMLGIAAYRYLFTTTTIYVSASSITDYVVIYNDYICLAIGLVIGLLAHWTMPATHERKRRRN